MEEQLAPVALTSLLSALGDSARVIPTAADLQGVEITAGRIWFSGQPLSAATELLVVPDPNAGSSALSELLSADDPLTIALCGDLGPAISRAPLATSPHAVIHVPDLADASTVLTTILHLTDPSRESELRKLTALQRSFSQALDHREPVSELLRRLQKHTNAVCLVVDGQGRVTESTGTIPLSQLMDQIRKTDAPSQRVGSSGWEGQAIRLQASDEAHRTGAGWLIIAARRSGFPDTLGAAAAHIAATLIESARRMQVAARTQEEAIRAAIFDEALELSRRPDAPELASRLSALGFSFDTPLRVLAVTGTHPGLVSRSTKMDLQVAFERVLESAEIPYLVTTRGSSTLFLTQAEVEATARALRVHRDEMSSYLIGIGRAIHAVTDISDSYADALIAVRTVRAGRHRGTTMAYEEFDFATRLFASVGLDRMATYSREFLAPLLEREPMLEALRRYFEFSQNTSATADALGIHHNTLRYRLSKVEELLEVNLNDPAAVASLFLATTSLDLMDMGAAKHLTSNGGLLDHDEGITRAGIASPRADRTPSPSITRSRPPRTPKY